MISGLSAGNYSVVVTDANGCSKTSTPFSFIPSSIADIESDLKIYPNPTRGELMIETSKIVKKIKILIISILFFNLSLTAQAKTAPESFADLAEKLIPSVVNISTTQTIVTNIKYFLSTSERFTYLFRNIHGSSQNRWLQLALRHFQKVEILFSTREILRSLQ